MYLKTALILLSMPVSYIWLVFYADTLLTALIAVLSGTTALLGQGSFTATGDRSWCSASQALSV